jgi:ubiquinone/menaquinone biosynthesis C-methylase UbiE
MSDRFKYCGKHIGHTIRVEVLPINEKEIKDYVRKSYSEIAQGKGECDPSCGCDCDSSANDLSLQIGYSKNELRNIPDSSNMGLGCGNPTALAGLKEGEIVVDLGSGGGIDVFLAAKKVGKTGKVIGVDMTEEMIKKAQSTASKYDYSNVEFKLGEIENLPLEDSSTDVIISNCVINLSPNKSKVFSEAFRILRPGGRILISDIVTEGDLPESLKKSYAAWAGCISGALEKKQYVNLIRGAGFKSVDIISESTFTVDVSNELQGKITSVQIEAKK